MARKSRAWLWIVFVFCLAAVCFVLRRAGDVPGVRQAPAGCPLEAIVKHVIDGDSFVAAEGYEVRLLNIDTPEYGEPLSKQAGARLKKLILGRRVSLSYDQEKKDRYGRLLCHVRVGGVWVNRLLVENGLATVFLVKPNLRKRAELTAAQNAARRKGIGIWSLPLPAPEEHYVYSRNGFRFHRPGCKFARHISARNHLKVRTRDEAFDMGLSPCRECRP